MSNASVSRALQRGGSMPWFGAWGDLHLMTVAQEVAAAFREYVIIG